MYSFLSKFVFLSILVVIYSKTEQDVCNEKRVHPDNKGFEKFDDQVIVENIKNWQAIVLLICYGCFALFVCLIYRILRSYIFFDSYLLDTFFDGGGDMNIGIVVVGIMGRYLMPVAFTKSAGDTALYGIAGSFWQGVGCIVALFLFGIVIAEIRVKAPGAKTFLQIIYRRFGKVSHITILIFAVTLNVLLMSAVCSEAMTIIERQSESLSSQPVAVIISIVVCFFTIVGGVGGSLYLAYFTVVLFYILLFIFYVNVYWNPLNQSLQEYGNRMEIHKKMLNILGPDKNRDCSMLTIISRDGVLSGTVEVLTGISLVFMNQAFWQSGISAKPQQGVWGFIISGLLFFSIPFLSGLAFGVPYLTISSTIKSGLKIDYIHDGMTAVYASQNLLGKTGDFMLFVMLILATIYVCSTQILGLSSIICYDIYMTYMRPFKPTEVGLDKSVKIRNAIRNEEFSEYDKRCVMFKHFVILASSAALLVGSLILNAIGIDLQWMLHFIALLVASSVLPVSLTVIWHRITGVGVISGSISGFFSGFSAWLIYSSTLDGGLKSFRTNTGDSVSWIIGMAIALFIGGIVCLIVSLSCGGCSSNLNEETVWEKTRELDNPIMPWSVKYAPNIKSTQLGKNNRPHLFTVRRIFKWSEYSAYIIGVLLSVLAVLIWPSSMLKAEVFSYQVFKNWTSLAIAWGVITLIFIILAPLVLEIIILCRQAYYNRKWSTDEEQLPDNEVNSNDDTISDENENVQSTPPSKKATLEVRQNENIYSKVKKTDKHLLEKSNLYEIKTKSLMKKETTDYYNINQSQVNQGYQSDHGESEHGGSSTMGKDSTIGKDSTKAGRWRTFIHLD